jgi:ribosomal protein L24E
VFSNQRFTARLVLDSSSPSFRFTDCTFMGLRTTFDNGGALSLQSTVASVSFSRNGFSDCRSAEGSGGAIYLSSSSFDSSSTCFADCNAMHIPVAYVSADKLLSIAHTHSTNAHPTSLRSFAFVCDCASVAVTHSNFSDHDFPAGEGAFFVSGVSACQFLHFGRNKCNGVVGMKLDAHGSFRLANFVNNEGKTALFDNQCFSIGMEKCCFIGVAFPILVNGHCQFAECSFDISRAEARRKMEAAAEVHDCKFEVVATVACSVLPWRICWGGAAGEGRISAAAAVLVGISLVLIVVAGGRLYTKFCRHAPADTSRLMYV